jgi:hypothetical protein
MDNIKEIIITSDKGVVDLTTDLMLLRGLVEFAIENGYLDELDEEEFSEGMAIQDILIKETDCDIV